MVPIRHAVAPAALLIAALAACDGGSGPPIPVDGFATLRIIQTAAVTGGVQVEWGGRQIASGLAQGASSGSVLVEAGAADLVLRAAGGGLVSGSRTLTLVRGQSYGVAAVDSSGVLLPQMLPDTNAIGVPGKSKLRVLHAAAHAPAIDIWRTQPDFPDQIRVMFPFNYRDISPYLQSDPGEWSILVTPAGLTDTLYLSLAFAVGDGRLATAMVMDSSAAGGIWVSVTEDN